MELLASSSDDASTDEDDITHENDQRIGNQQVSRHVGSSSTSTPSSFKRTVRPKKGDRVRLTPNSDPSGCLGHHTQGNIGYVVQDDQDRQPFRVECDGQTHFYKEGDVEVVDSSEADIAATAAQMKRMFNSKCLATKKADLTTKTTEVSMKFVYTPVGAAGDCSVVVRCALVDTCTGAAASAPNDFSSIAEVGWNECGGTFVEGSLRLALV
jgi:hypothetical protein